MDQASSLPLHRYYFFTGGAPLSCWLDEGAAGFLNDGSLPRLLGQFLPDLLCKGSIVLLTTLYPRAHLTIGACIVAPRGVCPLNPNDPQTWLLFLEQIDDHEA